MTRVKICGLTTPEDALCAAEAGAHALGFVFAESPRRIAPEAAGEILAEVGPFAVGVGVFVDATPAEVLTALSTCSGSVAQLHGSEGPDFIEEVAPFAAVKAFRVRGPITELCLLPFQHAQAILLDAYVPGRSGGTGQSFDHHPVVDLVARGWRIILAGGLTPDTVYDAIRTVRPYAVDVSSGVEASPGRKDHHKIRDFLAAVRAADAT